jgi:hypothetical protein
MEISGWGNNEKRPKNRQSVSSKAGKKFTRQVADYAN